MRGRKKTPAATDSPAVPVANPSGPSVPGMPEGMTRAGQSVWGRLVGLIAAMCPLRETDADALRQYCEAVALWRRACDALEDAELILVTPNGAYQANPLLKVRGQAEAVMLKLSERFGLDPASRRRLAIAADTGTSEFMEFLKRGRGK